MKATVKNSDFMEMVSRFFEHGEHPKSKRDVAALLDYIRSRVAENDLMDRFGVISEHAARGICVSSVSWKRKGAKATKSKDGVITVKAGTVYLPFGTASEVVTLGQG